MDVSIREPRHESLYPDLQSIGFHGIDVGFPAWNQRATLLYYEMVYEIANDLIRP